MSIHKIKRWWDPITQHFVIFPTIPIPHIWGSFLWIIKSVMPCKDHHCIPCPEDNIPSVGNSLSRPSETHVFSLALVDRYALGPMRKINTGPHAHWCSVPVSYPCQLVYGMFFKYRGEVSILTTSWAIQLDWFDWITTDPLLWPLVSTFWGNLPRNKASLPPF